MRDLSIQTLTIPFKQTFVHASAARAMTEAVLVTAANDKGMVGIGEGCPRRYVTGETVDSANAFFVSHRHQWSQLCTIEDLKRWVVEYAASIDKNPAVWCAVETALLDLLGKEDGKPIEQVVGGPCLTGRFRYSAVLGTKSLALFQKQLSQYAGLGFDDFKVKLSGCLQEDMGKLLALADAGVPAQHVRLDANNLWKDCHEAVSYLKELPYRPGAIEEPLQVGNYQGCLQLARELGVNVILDESFLRQGQFSAIQGEPSVWIVNIRVSKMGGIIRSVAIAELAKKYGIPIVIGAQVGETSILTRAALTVANGYRDILVAQEGAFGTYLLERDICQPSLMFGARGQLDSAAISRKPGLGLTAI